MTTIKGLAEQMSKAFTGDVRNDGAEFRKLRDGSPEWMTTVCRHAHGDMMPDDWRYEFIEQAVDKIAEADDDADDMTLDELAYEIEADVYTSELTAWLHSRVDRIFWIDEVLEESEGTIKSGSDLLMAAQVKEKQEVFNLVLEALRDMVADEEGEETDED